MEGSRLGRYLSSRMPVMSTSIRYSIICFAPGPDHTNNGRSMPKAPSSEKLLQNGSAEWNKLRKAGQVPNDHTGATFTQLFSANADLSGLGLVGSEWERCDLSKINFRDADLSNAYFHGGRL